MPHPDEGLIHAWLDGQLPPDEAARIEQLVASDAEWGAAAAEARGLIAASARILSALDHVPSKVIPIAPPAPRRMPRRRPWWLRAAAVVVVAGGSVVVLQRGAMPVSGTEKSVADAVRPTAPASPAPTLSGAVANAPATAPKRQVTQQLAQRIPSSATEAAVPMSAAAAPVPAAPSVAPSAASLAGNALALDARAEAVRDRAVPQAADAAAKVAAAPVESPPSEAARERVQMLRTAREAAPPPPATSAGASAATAANAPSLAFAKASPSAQGKVVGGVVKEITALRPTCFLVRDATAPNAAGPIMHAVRQVGDTLFLMPDVTTSPMRAWVKVGSGVRPGVRYTASEAAIVIAIVATPTGCAEP